MPPTLGLIPSVTYFTCKEPPEPGCHLGPTQLVPICGHLHPQGSDFFAQEHLPEHQEGTKGCFLKCSLGSQDVSLSQLQKAQALEELIFKGYNEEMGRRPQTN